MDGKLFVLGYVTPPNVLSAIKDDISLPIFDQETAQAYDTIAGSTGKKLKVHLKIDSGMGRLGIFPEDGVQYVRWLHTLKNLELEGLFTHFARADEPALPATNLQIKRFTLLVDSLIQNQLKPRWVHASNSAASIHFPSGWFDLVRPGIAIYGLSPSSQVNLPDGLQPAMIWKSRLCSVKVLPSDHGVGYGHRYVTKRAETVGAIAAGYADGFRRRSGNVVLVHGKRVPVLGSVCMDQSMIRLDDLPQARVGDEVILMGSQGDETISAEELAERWQTINYDVCTGLANRIPRIYLDS